MCYSGFMTKTMYKLVLLNKILLFQSILTTLSILKPSIAFSKSYITNINNINHHSQRNMAAISHSCSSNKDYELVVDPFCIRQFNNPSYTGSQINYSIEEFEKVINEYYLTGNYPLIDGYAPFW